jgi:hypothetical protein
MLDPKKQIKERKKIITNQYDQSKVEKNEFF